MLKLSLRALVLVQATGAAAQSPQAIYCQCPDYAGAFASDLGADENFAENFTLDQSGSLTRLRWWGVEPSSTPFFDGVQWVWQPCTPPSSFQIQLFADGGGVPGAMLYELPPAALVVRTVTGDITPISSGPLPTTELPLIVYEVTLPTPQTVIAAETYWIAIAGNSPNTCSWQWAHHSNQGDSAYASNPWLPTTESFAFCVELGPSSGSTDSDGDGLPDDWETCGVPYIDAAGHERRYLLDLDGDRLSDADPFKKDIFVEVDAMQGRAPSAETLQRVIDAFDPAGRILVPVPASAPGGKPNIRLHIATDPQHMALDRSSLTNGGDYDSVFAAFQIDKANYFGSPAELGMTERLGAKRRAFRYCIFANTHGNSSVPGVAEGVGCDDFMITLGMAVSPDGAPLPGGSDDQQASIFMHELGHALGLDHGGGDDINFKPNYLSIMNYLWIDRRFWQTTPWQLNYSESALPPLDENSLVEGNGLGANFPGVRVPYRRKSSMSCPDAEYFTEPGTGIPVRFAYMNHGDPVDWNNDCDCETPGVVTVDINDFSEKSPSTGAVDIRRYGKGLTPLNGFHDWANLRYDFLSSPHYGNNAPAADIGCNYNADLAQFLNSLIPFVPLRIACDGDGGDQSGCTNCPCMNNSPPGSTGGCLNSAGRSARLMPTGNPSVSSDTLRFEVTGGSSSAFAILTSGDNLAPANAASPCFGLNSGITSVTLDGLRCAVGNLLRHGTRPSDANGDVGVTTNGWGQPDGPSGGLIGQGGFAAGQVRHYQAIYREEAASGCQTGLNTSQAVTVTFQP